MVGSERIARFASSSLRTAPDSASLPFDRLRPRTLAR
jgi:hypothetical protein